MGRRRLNRLDPEKLLIGLLHHFQKKERSLRIRAGINDSLRDIGYADGIHYTVELLKDLADKLEIPDEPDETEEEEESENLCQML